jgi:hypothetical protein
MFSRLSIIPSGTDANKIEKVIAQINDAILTEAASTKKIGNKKASMVSKKKRTSNLSVTCLSNI